MATFVIDFFKGTLATLLPIMFHLQGVSPLIFGLLAVIGHTFPIFAGFKGGKAVATSAGVIFGFAPVFCLYLAVVFFGTLYLGSMIHCLVSQHLSQPSSEFYSFHLLVLS